MDMKMLALITVVVLGLAATMALVGCESGGSSDSGDNWDSYAGTWIGTGVAPNARTVTVTVSEVDGTVSLRDTGGNSATWPWNGDRFFESSGGFEGTMEFNSSDEGVVSYASGDVTIQKQ
jgi:hypothetical protein